MAEGNGNGVTGFFPKGPSDWPEVRFEAFDTVYSATFLGSGAFLLTLRADHRLHTPMYFFLVNISLLDVSRLTATIYFLVSPERMDVFLLEVTASKHRLAILLPLRYSVLMDGDVCASLAAGAWSACFLISPLHVPFAFTLTVCGSNQSRSAEGKRRAWFTCTSCLLAVGHFYGPAIFSYIRPSSGHSYGSDGLMACFMAFSTPSSTA
ncbi:olfactory receptor 1044-like [Tachyglossus aculeatus]|uniref:olfactory receptor 1044-like n=1 Tax=Tachyglossus aculeatus TaxID=9261 RepID=UPI0018F361FE|nr:olfactory receptor 1044-like [Tachyglossus aculeatus]